MPVTPESDPALEFFTLYLMNGLNAMYQNCVAAASPYDRIPTDPTLYPHLVLHRLDSEGDHLELCRAIARYLMVRPTDEEKLPGQFRTLQLAICQLLRTYDDDNRRRLIPAQRFRCRDRLISIGKGTIPFFEIEFQFVDLEGL